MAHRRELELERLKIEQEKQRLALEAEKAKLAKKNESMKVAALSAPAPARPNDVPLKIAIMPWNIKTLLGGTPAQTITERAAFKSVLQTVAEEPRVSVSHSFYIYDPPLGATGRPIDPLKLSQKEAKALWEKDGLSSRSKPSPEAARSLGEKI